MAITWDGANWTPSTTYGLNARVVNGGNAYLCTVAGISAALPSTGPSGTGSAITDGTVTWAYLGAYTGCVLDVAPELAGKVSISAEPVFLNLAEKLVADVTIWGDLLDDGRRYLAAHFGELTLLRGHGPVTAETVGPLSRSYATLSGPFSVDLTSAGRAYMDLVRTTPATFGFVV